MPLQKSKKILIYFFLFLLIGTLNNKNLSNFNKLKIKKIEINGLDTNDNSELFKNLGYVKLENLFFIDKDKIIKIINSNKSVEKYSVFKNYPSSLRIDIIKTEFLARIKRDSEIFFIGSNGKLIKSNDIDKDLPLIFGKFDNNEFLFNFNISISTNFLKGDFPIIAKNSEIFFLENIDNFSESEWRNLYKLSENTFVEESESLKKKAAGAGLTDND